MAVSRKPSPLTGTIAKPLPTTRLMDNQDTVKKGDGEKPIKVPTTILLPSNLKEEAQDYARRNGVSLTSLLVSGLRLRLDQQ